MKLIQAVDIVLGVGSFIFGGWFMYMHPAIVTKLDIAYHLAPFAFGLYLVIPDEKLNALANFVLSMFGKGKSGAN